MSLEQTPPSRHRRLFSGSANEPAQSYARAVVTGNEVRISGTTGFDYISDTLAEGARQQAEQIFRNAGNALALVGGTLADIVRVRVYIARVEDYDAVMDAFAKAFRNINPACTTLQTGLFDPDIRVEMDMDAVIDGLS